MVLATKNYDDFLPFLITVYILIESEKLELVATFFIAVVTLPYDFGLSWFALLILDCRLNLTSEVVLPLNFGLRLAGE